MLVYVYNNVYIAAFFSSTVHRTPGISAPSLFIALYFFLLNTHCPFSHFQELKSGLTGRITGALISRQQNTGKAKSAGIALILPLRRSKNKERP